MYYRLLLMSLLSLLFGCGNNAKNKGKYPSVPHFPQTDNPKCRVEPALLDTGFFAQAFILSADRQSVFVLAYSMAGAPEHISYQLLRLNAAGRVAVKTTWPDCAWEGTPRLWWEADGRLGVKGHNDIKTVNPASLETVQEWRQIDLNNFLTRKQLDQLTYDEQVAAYRDALQKSAGKSRTAFVRRVADLHFLMLEITGKAPTAWYLEDEEDTGRYVAQFGLRQEPANPAKWEGDDLAADGDSRLSPLEHLVLDYKIVYPNLKDIEENTFALSIGGKTARFKLSNKDKHSLTLQLADNQYFTTADHAAWLLYERYLYRLEIL